MAPSVPSWEEMREQRFFRRRTAHNFLKVAMGC
jgi:hypothetical protein